MSVVLLLWGLCKLQGEGVVEDCGGKKEWGGVSVLEQRDVALMVGWGRGNEYLRLCVRKSFYTVRGFNKIFKCSSLGRSGVGMRLDLEFWICDRVLDLYRD